MKRKDRQKTFPSPKHRVAAANMFSKGLSADNEDIPYANQLYEKAKSLSQDPKNSDEHIVKLIIESADDAIKEFGTTNQDKKIELRKIKAEAEKILPPDTIESLKKRAEGELLLKVYPKQRTFRRLMLLVIGVAILAIPLVFLIKELTKSQPPKPTETKESYGEETSQAPDALKQLPAQDQTKQIQEQTVPTSLNPIRKPLFQYIKRARMLYEQAQYHAALKECDKVLTVEPSNQEILYLKKRIMKTLEVLK